MATVRNLTEKGVDHFRRPHWQPQEFIHLMGIEDNRGAYVCDHTASRDRSPGADADPNMWDDWQPYHGKKAEVQAHVMAGPIYVGSYTTEEIMAGKPFSDPEAMQRVARATAGMMMQDLNLGLVAAAAGDVDPEVLIDFIRTRTGHPEEFDKEGFPEKIREIIDRYQQRAKAEEDLIEHLANTGGAAFVPPMQA